ncbi:hypothetical protein EV426DRAFT_720389 [Tirmania nivea]|nr:hypothetical protein EV426DRAFT_720389 [Tirmania nivea]
MPPSHNPPVISHSRHILQNCALILLSLSFLPFTTFLILIPCLIRAYLFPRRKETNISSQWGRLTLLVTNTEMTKGLALCRAFRAVGHRVIGADVVRDKPVSGEIQHRNGSPIMKWLMEWLDGEGLSFKVASPGKFSKALDAYYVLPDPLAQKPRVKEQKGFLRSLCPLSHTAASGQDGAPTSSASRLPLMGERAPWGILAFADESHSLISREKISLWIPVSSVISTIEEASSTALIPDICRRKQLIPPPSLTQILHNKDTFIKHTESLGLPVPESHLCTSTEGVLKILYGETTPYIEPKPITRKKFILKCIPLDDITRANLTTYPFPNISFRSLPTSPLIEFIFIKEQGENKYICQNRLGLDSRRVSSSRRGK